MSGGLDSAVACHRLVHRADVELFGFTMRIGDLEAQHDRTCCSLEDLLDAKKMCDLYGIPHYTLDVEDIFRENVVDPFVDTYLRGRTPNPCVWCNRTVKFGYLLEKVRRLGAEYLAMGHYARVERRGGESRVLRGKDAEKDQSYYMGFVDRDVLDHVWFPVGHFDKEQVREYAREHDIPVADKPESQSICFVPDMDYKKFIRNRTDHDPEPGPIRNIDGDVLGEHDGIVNYTVGQRRGLGIAHDNPLYVLEILPGENALVVGEKDRLMQAYFDVGPINWLAPPRERCAVQVRYNGQPHPCHVEEHEEGARVLLDEPARAIAPGQIAVFYGGERLLGGGVITEAPRPFEVRSDLEARVRPRARSAP